MQHWTVFVKTIKLHRNCLIDTYNMYKRQNDSKTK